MNGLEFHSLLEVKVFVFKLKIRFQFIKKQWIDTKPQQDYHKSLVNTT
jgi:hypothetical protein